MDAESRELLNRWESLRSGGGLARARLVTRNLWMLGLALFLVVLIGIYYRFPPVTLAVVSVVMGWTIAECNALKSRLAQWPTIAGYIDWDRVRGDLDGE
ncbi:hypothetical protein [Dyella sp. A6]|uniref:hypothetical protein n=1 Tax=Dyella aluminiiresistens TaxID=3069105 RepID=UPI002E7A7492|nr:hypothetical protein [Dyella sp. A6]